MGIVRAVIVGENETMSDKWCKRCWIDDSESGIFLMIDRYSSIQCDHN